MGPPVTSGINTLTGPFVRRLALPEWTSEEEITYLTAHCPNLHAIDVTEIFGSVPHPVALLLDDYFNLFRGEEDIDSRPSMLDRCPALFRNLRSIHLPYDCADTVYSHLYSYRTLRSVDLPKLLQPAIHLQTLELTCHPAPMLFPFQKVRGKASAMLLAEILNNVSRSLTTLVLNHSQSTIEELDSFLQSLEVFPKLRTVRLSLHRDLDVSQTVSQRNHGSDAFVYRQLNEYERDTPTALQYLSTVKKIDDRGVFSLVSSDCGESFHSIPREYYGLCHTNIVHRPRNDLWTPVWTWNDRIPWVQGYHPSVEMVDIGKCRALFGELSKAQIPVSVELGPLAVSSGAFFASPWVNGCYEFPYPASESLRPPNQAIQPKKLSSNTSESIAKRLIAPTPSYKTDAETKIPNPIWRLNEIGDLVDDLRLIWDRGFAYVYVKSFNEDSIMNFDNAEPSKRMYDCRFLLRTRLSREAEHTALLFRRIPVDFPRLTRFALYIPAALYPNHDQTFINHVLPGTGWTVKHYGPVGGTPPICDIKEAHLKLADDICPFIRRIFTRPAPSDDPSAVIFHDEEWHGTQRPVFDLDGEYKSMDRLLTEPLR